MLIKVSVSFSIAHKLDNKIIKLSKLFEWSNWLLLVEKSKPGTVYQLIKY